MVYRPRTPQPTEAATPEELGVEREIVSITVDGQRHPLDKRSVVLGRSRDCDIRVEDPERLAPPRRDPPGGSDLLDRRPRLDQRPRGQRPPRQAREARGRRPGDDRLDGASLRSLIPVIAVSTVEVEELLLGLKLAFLVVLYLFIWRIVRTASKDLRLPQESFILDPEQAAALRQPAELQTGELVVLRSPALVEGERHQLNSAAGHDRPRLRATTSRSTRTSSPRRGTRGSSRGATACGSRTSARRTAPS